MGERSFGVEYWGTSARYPGIFCEATLHMEIRGHAKSTCWDWDPAMGFGLGGWLAGDRGEGDGEISVARCEEVLEGGRGVLNDAKESSLHRPWACGVYADTD